MFHFQVFREVINKAMRSSILSVRFFQVRSKNKCYRFGFFRFGLIAKTIGSVFFGSVQNRILWFGSVFLVLSFYLICLLWRSKVIKNLDRKIGSVWSDRMALVINKSRNFCCCCYSFAHFLLVEKIVFF